MEEDPDRARTEQVLWRSLFLSIMPVLNRVESDVKAASDLTLLDVGILFALAHSPGGRPMGQLAALFGVDPSVVTYRLGRLEKKKYAARAPSPADGRLIQATITEPGRRALRASRAAMLDSARERFFAHLEPADLPALEVAFSRLYEAQLASGG